MSGDIEEPADARAPLFRPEAVQDYAATRMQGRLLQLSPRWASWVFWLLLAALVGAIAFASIVRVDRWVVGTGVLWTETQRDAPHDGGDEGEDSDRNETFLLVAFPASQRASLSVGADLHPRFGPTDSEARSEARIVSIHPEILGPAGVREAFGHAADHLAVTDLVVVVRAAVDAEVWASRDVSLGSSGRVEIRTGRPTLLQLLVPGRR